MEEKDAVKKALDFRKLKKENFVVLFLIGLLKGPFHGIAVSRKLFLSRNRSLPFI